MYKKILIANRGEIAVRIQRACRELGIETVAVFSDADRQAVHVRFADEAYYLGGSPARDSYLQGEKIIEIARRCGADAIHPGYGFLAERSDFAYQCIDSGLAFIGPRPASISSMGNKAVARRTVAKAGVPVVPGTEAEGDLRDEELLQLAPVIGFPLLIKATSGGGGKGMREVNSLEEMPGLLHSARREAEASFGDGNVYLEKLLLGAHHIEFQILADQHGNVIHLGERDCSIQRRHQKLIEEGPSPFIGNDDSLRNKMGDLAVQAARSVDYTTTGTIEFLVDNQKNFYFLEMNTRLQVEHPVTEMLTGLDIVVEQIRIAYGSRLRYTQKDIHWRGAAIECRINTEDPYNQFIPSTGFLTMVQLPTGPGIRVDSGVYVGFEITPFYDPLIAKLIAWGETRQQAIMRIRRALEEYRIVGVRTNIPFHQTMMASFPFLSGNYDTRFVEEQLPAIDAVENRELYLDIAALLATLVSHTQTQYKNQYYFQSNHKSTWKWTTDQKRSPK